MNDIICPSCDGRKENFVFVNRGTQPHTQETWPCSTCKGIGSITAEHMARIEAGAVLRAERQSRDMSLREEAARLGIKPSELSARENGRE